MQTVAHMRSAVVSALRARYTQGLLRVLAIACLASLSHAAQQSSEDARWGDIRQALLGERAISDGAALLALDTPVRALDAAVVPVEITTRFEQTAQRYIHKLYLVIDQNPSPVAAVFEFPGDRDWTRISTRVRVNAYTDVRAVAELNDGSTFMVKNFVKASGGCSAPALKDPAAAAAQLGRMKLLLPEDAAADDLFLTRLMIRHPNSSGMQFDQVTRHFIPADYVRNIEVRYNDQLLYKVATDISISENPMIAFGLRNDPGKGELDVRVLDTEGRQFEKRFPLTSTQ